MVKLHLIHILGVRRTRWSKKRPKYIGGWGVGRFLAGFCDRIGVGEAFHTTILRSGKVIFCKHLSTSLKADSAVRPTVRFSLACGSWSPSEVRFLQGDISGSIRSRIVFGFHLGIKRQVQLVRLHFTERVQPPEIYLA